MTVLEAVTVMANHFQSLPWLTAVFDRDTGGTVRDGQRYANLHGTVRTVFTASVSIMPVDLQ